MKALSNNPIIPGEQVDSWQSWAPADLGGLSSTLTPAQLVELVAKRRQEPPRPAEMDAPGEAVADNDPPPGDSDPADGAVAESSGLSYPTAAELEAIHQDAWQTGHDAGYAAGHAEGLDAGKAEAESRALAAVQQQFAEAWVPLARLADSFNQQLQQVESELAGSLLSLAVRLAEKLVQDHLQVNGRALEPVLRQVLDDLPASLAQARLRVNPADLTVARQLLQQETPETLWQWIEDPAIERGGCIIDTSSIRLDLTLASRLRALSDALGLESADSSASHDAD